MLEIRYEIASGIITAWCGDSDQFGNLKRKGYTVTILDIPIPDKPLEAWLYDGTKLVPNPGYVEPEPPRDLVAEVDALIERLDKLDEK